MEMHGSLAKFPYTQWAIYAEICCDWCCQLEQAVGWAVKLPSIWDTMMLVWRERNAISVAELAFSKPSWQHSTAYGGVASRANDGNSNSNFNAGSCSHTNVHTYPTWGVDLQVMSIVYYVEIQTRGDAPVQGMCMNQSTVDSQYSTYSGLYISQSFKKRRTIDLPYINMYWSLHTPLQLIYSSPVFDRFVRVRQQSQFPVIPAWCHGRQRLPVVWAISGYSTSGTDIPNHMSATASHSTICVYTSWPISRPSDHGPVWSMGIWK